MIQCPTVALATKEVRLVNSFRGQKFEADYSRVILPDCDCGSFAYVRRISIAPGLRAAAISVSNSRRSPARGRRAETTGVPGLYFEVVEPVSPELRKY